MSSRYLHPESQKRVQSKSKASLDDFDRQTLYSKIMVNLGTNPFMDTIQSPSCSSIQDYISHYDEINNNIRQNEKNVETAVLKKNQLNEYLQKPSSRISNNSPHSAKPSGPFQKKNLKKLLNKSKKDQTNSDYDFTMQDSITDENPNIETKVQELNNNQTCNFTKFEILKKKTDKLNNEGNYGNSGNITMIKKPPLTSQESAQNTQSTQVFLNSPCIKTIEKTQTPKSYKINMEDLSQNNLSPFQYDQGVMNTNNSQKSSMFLQKTNLSNLQVDNLIENQEINSQQNVKNLNLLGAVNELKKVNQIPTDTNQLQNQYNFCTYQQTNQSQINFQSQNNQIINSPILQSSQVLQSQQQIYQSMFQTSVNFQQNNQQLKYSESNQETNKNIPVCQNFLNQFENLQKLNSPDNINNFQNKQEGLYLSYQQCQANEFDSIQSPQKQVTSKQISLDDRITHFNQSKNELNNNITVFNSGEAALYQNNLGISQYPNPNKNITISSNLSLSTHQPRQYQNTAQPYYNQMSQIHNQGQKRSDNNFNNYMSQLSQDNINLNIEEKSGNKFNQNEGKINSISYQNLNQLKQSQISNLNNTINNSQMFSIISNSNMKDPSQLNHLEQLNLLQIQQKLADNKNKIEDISLKINAQLNNCQESYSASKNVQDNNSFIIQNSSAKEANPTLNQTPTPIKREKENPITRLRNKSQPNGQRGIYKSPNLQPMIFAKKEDNLSIKKPFNLKNDMSSLLYNEEEKIKKSNKFPQNLVDNKNDKQTLLQKTQIPQQINGDINYQNTNLNMQLANQVPIIQSQYQTQLIDNNLIQQDNNQYINQQQPMIKQLPNNQTSFNLNYEVNPINNQTDMKTQEINANSQTKIPINNKTSQKDRVSPISGKDKIQRSQSYKDVIQNQQDKVKNNSFSTQKNQPTTVKQRNASQYTPSYNKQQTINTGFYSQIQIPPNNNQTMQKKTNENKAINNPSEQKFQQPESPLKYVEPYSPFNTNRNSTSFIYDLNSFKNIQSSLSVAQYQQQCTGQVQQQQQQHSHQQQENIQFSTLKEQNKGEFESSNNKLDKNVNKQTSQNMNNHMNFSNNKNISNLTNNPRVLNEQSFNIKKQLNQQIDKKLKMNQSDQNSSKKELPKNPITCMRIHQKSNSISGQLYGVNKFSSIQNSIK
ncbi:hypothetical protein TTHERM_00497850 (macronuclear) [Tetrahymena thermophila SB210]|uniref:Uncharacterized protein n=1 Tax=Tetrahymena thermophila (strain SB210) TaxID=312017 RepID=I7MN17_TETTS|nr:hypothetical protein TTHERM_00497850 [Tetrahymena thermophila SB210]EAS07731.3 hypothetical protein TTHERM_00497850 [Tetrahymena thermophila SB210]|eukprot:XP_001027973.3 hypothetical protein TTHERM_00497850 [Tetrahymena thermophila SB210]